METDPPTIFKRYWDRFMNRQVMEAYMQANAISLNCHLHMKHTVKNIHIVTINSTMTAKQLHVVRF